MRKRPPFAHVLSKRLSEPESWPYFWGTSADGSRLSLWCVCGENAWEWAHTHRHTHLFVILPDDSPETYKWDVLCGHDPVIVYQTTSVNQSLLDRLAYEILCCGVLKILVIDGPRYLAGKQI